MKRSKLTEKATRIPDTRSAKWGQAIQQYLHDIKQLNKEQARSHRFSMLLQQLLGIEPNFIESYTSGIEKSLNVKQKDCILRGEADNLFGNVIIEFEQNILKKRSEAEEQLHRYVAILWSQEPLGARTPYLCIATDGVHFLSYTPTLDNVKLEDVKPENVSFKLLEDEDWTKLKPEEVFNWLDRYFLRKEILHPTSEKIVSDFGVKSHAFQTITNTLLATWKEIRTQSTFSVIYESWEKYLRIVYGSEVAGDELFIRHTYLATLAKLMAWMRISESTSLADNEQIVEILEGRFFKAQGIENFIEEDFFSWLVREDAVKISISIVRLLLSLLQNYNLHELSEDVLKSLYQELVDPETRHDLGEFYTPDWLAHRMVNKLLDTNPYGSMFDPACGSGTFLYLAIREKRVRLRNSLKTLQHILNSIYGADIHPLAVIIAKTNYILALGVILKKRKTSISIPVYLADTLKLPAQFMKGPQYEIRLGSQTIFVDRTLLENLSVYDHAIELAKEFVRQNKKKPISLELFNNFLVAQHFKVSKKNVMFKSLYAIVEVLKHFLDIERDTIWAYILKNIYKPLFLKRKFDFVIGNPPWIAFRFMEPAYQEFLKWKITKDYKLLVGRGELITHLEVATLFLVRAADLYLKTGGTISFVLPKSLFSADQHDQLRKRTFRFSENPAHNLFYKEIWDCENVVPLFNVPACILIANKVKTEQIKYPVTGQVLSGKLERKNASLAEVEKVLIVDDVKYYLHTYGKRSFWATDKSTYARAESYYKAIFAQGATIVPRSFWFVQIEPSQVGFNPDLPLLETAKHARKLAKYPYKTVYFKDTVESHFIFATLLSTDLLPFGHFNYRLVVLPIEPQGIHYKLIKANEARKLGYLNLERWLKKAEQEWKKYRGEKAKHMNIYERLDRVHGLSSQNPQAKYRVMYNTSGTFLTAAVVKKESINFEIDGQHILAKGFIADTKTYICELNNIRECFFLVAVLNSPVLNKLIKPMQSRGLWGPRDIHKKPLELPIPQFDTKKTTHYHLVKIGKDCSAKVRKWIEGGGARNIKSIGKLRGMAREMLKEELKEIDILVKKILR